MARLRSKPVVQRSREPRPAGARQYQLGLGSRLSAWVASHRFHASDSLRRLLRAPVQSFLTGAVVAIALALPAVLYLTLLNVQQVTTSWEGNARVSVFLKQGARQEAIDSLAQAFAARSDVLSVKTISADEAREEFAALSGLGDILASLESNPLPAVLELEPKSVANSEALATLVEELRGPALVDDVRLDMAWVQRLQQITELGRRVVSALSALLAIGVVLVIGNTLRLAIENRRDEIQVVKLVGGTDAFVRRPFLYTGLWYGCAGGLLASLLVAIGLGWLERPIHTLSSLYQSNFQLQGLEFRSFVAILSSAALLGWVGAWLAVSRHLRAIQPA